MWVDLGPLFRKSIPTNPKADPNPNPNLNPNRNPNLNHNLNPNVSTVARICTINFRNSGPSEQRAGTCGLSSVFTHKSSYCFQRVLAIAILSVRLSVTRVDQSKAVQARITKFLPSAVWKTLV